MLRVLDSDEKTRQRQERRAKRKTEYEKYLESPTWKSIRRKVLGREKNICQGCGERATCVHHNRYPKNLGEEKLKWLYALCAPCHDQIHRLAAQGMTLRKATRQVVGLPTKRERQQHHLKRKKWHKEQRRKKQRREPKLKSKPRMGLTVEGKKKPITPKLVAENDRLHQIQARNRERRTAQSRVDLSDLLKGE